MPKNLENTRINVYSEKFDIWRAGRVVKFLINSRRFKVEYENAKIERLDLTKAFFIIDSSNQINEKIKSPTKKGEYKHKGTVGRPLKYKKLVF